MKILNDMATIIDITPKNLKSLRNKLGYDMHNLYLNQWLIEDDRYNPRGYLMKKDNQTMGFILIRDARDIDGSRCVYIAFIYVSPSLRNNKI